MTNILNKKIIYQALCNRHGRDKQNKLNQAKVAIAGLGGLGSNVAIQLARIGIGQLHLIDFDKVDISNLNRQHYFIKHLGQYKTQALAQQILEINPYLKIVTDCIKVTDENIANLFKDDDIICEAFDIPENKAILVNKILEIYPQKYIIAGSGMAGFGQSNDIHTRKIMKNFYICGDEVTALTNENCLMAPRVAICASHQANLITQLILENNI